MGLHIGILAATVFYKKSLYTMYDPAFVDG